MYKIIFFRCYDCEPDNEICSCDIFRLSSLGLLITYFVLALKERMFLGDSRQIFEPLPVPHCLIVHESSYPFFGQQPNHPSNFSAAAPPDETIFLIGGGG